VELIRYGNHVLRGSIYDAVLLYGDGVRWGTYLWGLRVAPMTGERPTMVGWRPRPLTVMGAHTDGSPRLQISKQRRWALLERDDGLVDWRGVLRRRDSKRGQA
jgi:hypothetical protein